MHAQNINEPFIMELASILLYCFLSEAIGNALRINLYTQWATILRNSAINVELVQIIAPSEGC